MSRRFHLFFSALMAIALWGLPVQAATGPEAETPQLSARLLAGTAAAGRLPMGLEIKLNEGWKIYWRTPGDAGLPPSLDWSGESAVRGSRMFWPAPHRFVFSDLQSFGYKGTVLLPFELELKGAAPSALKSVLDIQACTDICVPITLPLAITGTDQPDPEVDARLSAARAAIPGPPRQDGLWPLTLSWQREPPAVILDLQSTTPLEAPDAFIEAEPYLPLGSPVITYNDDRTHARLTLPFTGGKRTPLGSWMDRPLTVTVTDGAAAVEAQMRPQPLQMAPPISVSVPAAHRLPVLLLLALLGGLILNLMPCVLPVLSIKLLSVISHGGAARGTIRRGFLASAVGVLLGFWALAAVLIGLKTAGHAIGWGIQFQQPLFLSILVAITVLFAGNLFGWFEIQLPSALADRLGRPSGENPNLLGHLLSGALAMVLATPCSAPFLGTAIGFALAAGPGMILLIFTAVGLGLALPYLLVAAWPGMVARLPRPGAWMIKLRLALGVALVATAGWLLHVLAGVAGERVGWMALGLGVIVLLLLRLAYHRRPVVPLVVTALAALILTPLLAPAAATARSEAGPYACRPFESVEAIRRLARTEVVFVDVTADWCLTCQANKRLVLHQDRIAAALTAPGTHCITADWTRPDAKIAAFLSSHGRYGIPFNVVYGPAAPDGIPLPELLTPQPVLDALKQARGP